MPQLKKILLKYDKNIRPYIYKIELEDGRNFSFTFKKENLKHLLGLHYIFNNSFSASLIYQQIKKEKLTLTFIKSAYPFYYKDIEIRVLRFEKLELLFNTTEIIEFDSTKLLNCKLKSSFLLFDKSTGEVLHLGLADKTGIYYPETWFIRTQDKEKYIKNQKILKMILTKENK